MGAIGNGWRAASLHQKITIIVAGLVAIGAIGMVASPRASNPVGAGGELPSASVSHPT